MHCSLYRLIHVSYILNTFPHRLWNDYWLPLTTQEVTCPLHDSWLIAVITQHSVTLSILLINVSLTNTNTLTPTWTHACDRLSAMVTINRPNTARVMLSCRLLLLTTTSSTNCKCDRKKFCILKAAYYMVQIIQIRLSPAGMDVCIYEYICQSPWVQSRKHEWRCVLELLN